MSVDTVGKNNKIIEIKIEKIIPNAHQPRQIFDSRSLAQLASSIRQYGVIQPITVRKIENEYRLVAGERRLRAARMAGLEKVPCIIREIGDHEAVQIALLENIQRADLTLVEEAQAYVTLTRFGGCNSFDVIEKMCKHREEIIEKMDVLHLPKEVLRVLARYRMSREYAIAVLALDTVQEQLQLLHEAGVNGYSVNQVREKVYSIIAPPPVQVHRYRRIKDHRIMANTIFQAIEVMRRSGVSAKTVTKEDDARIEYIITITK